MRDTGVITKGLSGDTDTATAQMGIARTQLGILKNQMDPAKLQVGVRAVRLPDGTAMRVSVSAGISRVDIYSPPGSTSEETPIELATPEVPEPVLPPRPPRYIIQGVRGFLNGSGSGLYPFTLNGVVITAPARPGQVLALGPHVKYGFMAENTGSSFPVAIVDADTGLVIPSQSEITATSPAGDFPFYPPSLISPTVFTPKGVKAIGGKSEPADLTYLSLNPAWDDVEIKLRGTGPDGSPASNSFILGGGAIMIAGCAGLAGRPVVINGVSTTVGVVVPCTNNQISVQYPAVALETSVGVAIETEIAYNPPKPEPAGAYLSGGNYNMVWTPGAGSFSLTPNLTQLEIFLTAIVSGSGTWTASGTLTVGDGYGATKDIPVDVTVTIT